MSETSRLRPEAGLVPYKDLTSDQRAVFDRLYEFLIDAAENSPKRSSQEECIPKYLVQIDRTRHHLNFFIDGDRGSGKTTVMLCVLETLKLRYLKSIDKKVDRKDFVGAPRLKASDTPIVPLPILDLDPLPEDTNLQLFAANQLRLVLDDISPTEKGAESSPWLENSQSKKSARSLWNEFVRNVATSWHHIGRPESRASVEERIIELEEAEQLRSTVRPAFCDFVDALCAEFTRHHFGTSKASQQEPLFVIPIDDADLNPEFARPLIYTLQQLQHPRVAFVITGDKSGLLESLESDRYRHKWAPLRGELARKVFDKVIPRQQLMALDRLSARERFTNEVIGTRATLRAVPFETNEPRPLGQSEWTLADYLDTVPFTQEALPSRIRPLQDFVLDVKIATVAGRPISAATIAHQLLLDAIQAEPDASEQIRAALVPVDTAIVAECKFDIRFESIGNATTLDGRETEFRFKTDIQGSVPDKISLSPPTTAATALVLDVAFHGTLFPRFNQNNPKWRFQNLFARVRTYREQEGIDHSAGWLTPDWYGMLDLHVLTDAWVSVLQKHKNELETNVAAAAYRFIELVLSVIRIRHVPAKIIEPRMDGKLDWDALAERVVGVAFPPRSAGPRSYRETLNSVWAKRRVGLLAAPEYGLPAPDANALLNSLRKKFGESRWKFIEGELVDERLSIIRAELRRGNKDTDSQLPDQSHRSWQLARALVEAFPTFEWNSMMKFDDSEQRQLVQNFESQLRVLTVRSLRRPDTNRVSLDTVFRDVDAFELLMSEASHRIRSASALAERFMRAGRPAEEFIEQCWRDFGGASNTANPALRLLQSNDMNRPLLRVETTLVDEWHRTPFNSEADQQLRSHPSPMRISSRKLRVNDISPIPGSKSAPMATVLLRAALEIHTESEPKTEPQPPSPLPFEGIECHFPDRTEVLRWPLPRWIGVSRYLQLEKYWAPVVEQTRSFGSRGDDGRASQVDLLIAWYLHNMIRHATTASTEQSLSNSASSAIRNIVEATQEQTSSAPNEQAFRAWAKYALLFACPEYGASPALAKEILNARIGPTSVKHTTKLPPKPTAAELNTLRLEWCTKQVGDQKTAQELLASIDQASATSEGPHPWVQWMSEAST